MDIVTKGDAEASGKKVASAPTKAEAIKKTAGIARRDPAPVTVKIHKADGRFQEEGTYPRKSDPRSSKG